MIRPSTRRPLRALLGLATALLVAAAALAGCGRVRAGYLMRDALDPPDDLLERVTEEHIQIPGSGGPTPARVTRPRDAAGPLPAVLVLHGAVRDGANDPRLLALARALAAQGATVVTPTLRSLERFTVDPADPERVAEAIRFLADADDLTEDGRVAVLGISVGGAYGLVAAAEPDVAPSVSAVLAFGAYDDLETLISGWMTEPAPAPGLFDPFTEGRRLVLLGNLERLVPEHDRGFARATLRSLLDGREPPPVPAGLGPEALRVVGAARSADPIPPEAAAALLAPLHAELERASPARQAGVPTAPVYLLHGEADPIVPTASVERLADYLEDADGDVELHVTDLFGHVDAGGSPGLVAAWPILGFLADFLSDAGL